jgi:hypothetical protein
VTQYRKLADDEVIRRGDFEADGDPVCGLGIEAGRMDGDYFRPIRWQSEGEWRWLDVGEREKATDAFLCGQSWITSARHCGGIVTSSMMHRRLTVPSEVYELRDGRMVPQAYPYEEYLGECGEPIESPEDAAAFANEYGLPVPGWRHPHDGNERIHTDASILLFDGRWLPMCVESVRSALPTTLPAVVSAWLIPDTDEENDVADPTSEQRIRIYRELNERLDKAGVRAKIDTDEGYKDANGSLGKSGQVAESQGAGGGFVWCDTDEGNEDGYDRNLRNDRVCNEEDNVADVRSDMGDDLLEDPRTRLQRVLDGDEPGPYDRTAHEDLIREVCDRAPGELVCRSTITNPYREREVGYDDQWGEEFEVW